jgi:small conductance mechanosensitive channel
LPENVYAIVTILVRIALAILTILVSRWLAGWAKRGVLAALAKVTLPPSMVNLAARATYYGCLAAGVVLALVVVGVPATALLASLGLLVVVVGVALRESIANFAATVIFLLFEPFKAGDLIEACGEMGVVTEIQAFNTVLTKMDNRIVILSNGRIQENNLINYTRNGNLRADLAVEIGYGADIALARTVILDTLRSDPRLLPEPPPTVGVTELGDSGLTLTILPWVKSADYFGFRTEMRERLKLALEEQGIAIPYPHMEVRLSTIAQMPVASGQAS